MMRSRFLFIILFIICFVFMFSSFLLPERTDLSKRPLRSERSHDYDVLHYKIKLTFDYANKTFKGMNTISLKALRDGFDQCRLDAETFTVTGVTQDNKTLAFKQVPHEVIVYFKPGYRFEEKITFTIHYEANNVKADPTRFGMSERYPIGLTFVEKTSKNPRLIQALSFPTGARHWFPCYDHPNDKATQEIIATVGNDFKVLANGELVSISQGKDVGTNTYHWFQKQPHPTYLSMLVAGPYRIVEDSLGDLKINYWVYQKDLKHARRSFGKTPGMIEFFNKEFGYEYPWAKYDQITIPGIGGGAECTSATLIGQGTIHDEKAEKDYPSHWLVAHETAHQWWGDLVTCRDWGHTWINESFGTYYDYVYTKHDLGEEEGAINLLGKKNKYLAEARNRYIRPIVYHRWNVPADNFDSHTYPKGAAVIHMMRRLLGEKPFKKTISLFLHKHAFEPADTHDFLTAVKEATGQNIDWFFQQWLFKPGHPVFKVSAAWEPLNKRIRVTVAQTQDTSKGIPVFKTPVVFKIVTPAGSQLQEVWLRKKEEVFHFPCTQKPAMVRFDEGNYLLKEWTYPKSPEELLFQLKHDDVIGRGWAAMELSKLEKSSGAVQALKTAAKEDVSWYVRKEAVLALGKISLTPFISFLKQAALDKHSKVRAAALSLLGNSGSPRLVPFFIKRYKHENSYLVQSEILKAIGKCGSRAQLDFLEKAGETKSPRDVLARAARWAMNKLNHK